MNRRVVHYLHIGKTGGTALVHALDEHRVCVVPPRWEASSPYALSAVRPDAGVVVCVHPHDETLADVPVGERVFFVLRDPLARFASGFCSRQRQGRPRYVSPWSPGEREAFGRFATPDELGRGLGAADETTRRAARRAMQAIMHVRDGYAHWLRDAAYLRERAADVFFVGRQESLDDDARRLGQLLGLSGELRLPADDVAAFRNPEGRPPPLSQEARANLREWYRADYELLEFCRARWP